MKKILLAAFLLAALPASADRLQIVSTYPYIASITEQIGQERVRVHALAGGQWDPHTILPKPSFIAKLRRADLLIINGAQLEIGWLPPLMNQANNPRIAVGSKGLLDLSRFVQLMDVPTSVSRAHGDIHPDGNPHYYLDPVNIPLLAKAIMDKLIELDATGAGYYRKNHAAFIQAWNEQLTVWDKKMAKLKGITVIEYHKNLDYFLARYEIKLMDTVEMLPGIPPTSKHIAALEEKIAGCKVCYILQDIYNPDEASRHLATKFNIPMVKMPHDVGSVPGAEGIFALFEEIIRRITHD